MKSIFFPIAASLFFLAGQPADAARDHSFLGAQRFVRQFYAWYVPTVLQDGSEPATAAALDNRRDLFDVRLATALVVDARAQARTPACIVGLDYDPFLMTQDPARRYRTGFVRKSGADFLVDIVRVGRKGGKSGTEVVAQVRSEFGAWKFVNFISPHGGDLLGSLRALKRERTEHPESGC